MDESTTRARFFGGPIDGQAMELPGEPRTWRVPTRRPSVLDELRGQRREVAVYVREDALYSRQGIMPDGRSVYRFDGMEAPKDEG